MLSQHELHHPQRRVGRERPGVPTATVTEPATATAAAAIATTSCHDA